MRDNGAAAQAASDGGPETRPCTIPAISAASGSAVLPEWWVRTPSSTEPDITGSRPDS